MANDKTSPADKHKAKDSSRRKYAVKDERLLSPVFVDHSTLAVGAGVIVHSLFQTEIPVGDLRDSDSTDSVLVGRFVYPADYFRALTVMLARQYITFEAGRGKGEEALGWLQQELMKQAAQVGIGRSKRGH